MAEPNQTAYFISDAHLGTGSKEEEAAKERLLLSFLDRYIQPPARLFILGDLYDYWFEYRTVIPRAGIRVTAKFIELARRGTPVTYVGGNHDYWLGGGFLREVGIAFHAGAMDMKIGSKSFFIAHGDERWNPGICQRIVNTILHNPVNIRLYSLIHPDIGLALARCVSRLSRWKSSGKVFNFDEDYMAFVEAQFNRGIDNVVLGHAHRPFFSKHGKHTFVNIGDWLEHNTYGYFDGSSLILCEWKENIT